MGKNRQFDEAFEPQQRLELFVPVCQAIQHAHQKDIIHRDISPPYNLNLSHPGRLRRLAPARTDLIDGLLR